LIGDLHGLNTSQYQPAKIAAMEAHWDSDKPAPLVLFALPNKATESNDFEIAIPNLASLIITHDSNGLFKGLKDFKPEDRPPITSVFFAFRVMVGIGVTLIAIGVIGAWLWWRGKVFAARWYLRPVSYAWPLGFVAILAGWLVTESGRQPWIAVGILRTADAVSPVPASVIVTSLALFVLVYCVVFSIGVRYIRGLIRKGPKGMAAADVDALPNRPLAAATDAAREANVGVAP
jgi:cytochrome d ubiquinol oxidase subunit I